MQAIKISPEAEFGDWILPYLETYQSLVIIGEHEGVRCNGVFGPKADCPLAFNEQCLAANTPENTTSRLCLGSFLRTSC